MIAYGALDGRVTDVLAMAFCVGVLLMAIARLPHARWRK